jgi:hypothetical protein
VVDKQTRRIVCTAFGKGRGHDFRLFKESGTKFKAGTKCTVDTAYQGMAKLHPNVWIPKKRSKNKPLTLEDKSANRVLSSQRIVVENVIRDVKIFKILAERYRNRRKRFGLRFNLLAAIYNLNLSVK